MEIAIPSTGVESSNNLNNGNNGRISYFSDEKSNVTILSGIFSFLSQFTSSSSDSIPTDHSKICRYCLSDGDISEWLAPCKCIGTMRWVHSSCFEQWLSFAPYYMKYSCAICNYVYRRQWRLKPYRCWHWPQFRLCLTDLFGIYFDIILTYRLCRYFPRCLDNKIKDSLEQKEVLELVFAQIRSGHSPFSMKRKRKRENCA